jgi:hypothetical protein
MVVSPRYIDGYVVSMETGVWTYPRAMAPTKTATECVSGRVGRNLESRMVGASAHRAEGISRSAPLPEHHRCRNSLSLIVLVGKWSVMGFCGHQLQLKATYCPLHTAVRVHPP